MSIVKNGKFYFYDFVHEGKRYRKSCRTTDKKLAEQVEISVKNDIIKEEHLLPTDRNKNLLFKAAWESYLKNIGGSNTKKTIERKIVAAVHFLPFLENKRLSDITTLDIKNYHAERRIEMLNDPKNNGKKESEINFRSINLEKATLSHFFNFCIEHGYIHNNPVARIKKLNELKRVKTLSDEDIKKLIENAPNRLTKDLISFLIYSGCRKGEALNLKWDDVDLKNDVIAIKGTKTKYDRYIPVSKPLKVLLGGIDIKSEYVFTGANGKVKDFKDSFKAACRNAGLKDLRIHDLRHVFASKMVMNGTSLYITGELLGHRTTQMTKRYSHLVPDTLKKAVNEVWGKQ
ncbi:MAG: site-specific integrase [Deltaproteobacteria bacterium]|nr:site-specific integrase [Deltaproteobacteria bacterium]MCL5892874.1 site-specific integrase [Deltaproteobacteria bacterium]